MAEQERPEQSRRAIPRKDSIWRCPCGYTGYHSQMGGHRRKWRSRPDCQGKIYVIDPGSPDQPYLYPHAPKVFDYYPDEPPPYLQARRETALEPEPTPVEEALAEIVETDQPGEAEMSPEIAEQREREAPQGQPQTPKESPPKEPQPAQARRRDPFEFTGSDVIGDPEAVARLYNEQRLGVAPTSGPPGDGSNGEEPEYKLIPPGATPEVSFIPESVKLPVIVRVMYDWAKSEGWHVGAGTLAEFVADMLLDHFRNCMGMRVVVLHREEYEGG